MHESFLKLTRWTTLISSRVCFRNIVTVLTCVGDMFLVFKVAFCQLLLNEYEWMNKWMILEDGHSSIKCIAHAGHSIALFALCEPVTLTFDLFTQYSSVGEISWWYTVQVWWLYFQPFWFYRADRQTHRQNQTRMIVLLTRLGLLLVWVA